MLKEKKFIILFLVGIIIFVSNTFSVNDRLAVIKKDILKMHAEVLDFLKKMEKDKDGTIQIHLGGGLHASMGGRERFVFEENVNIEVSGSELTKIEFFYTQTREKNMEDTQSVTFLNEKPNDEEFSGLTLIYIAGLEKDAKFIYSEVDEEYQYRILIGYREKLEKLIRSLAFFYESSMARESAGLGKVLEVGKEQENN